MQACTGVHFHWAEIRMKKFAKFEARSSNDSVCEIKFLEFDRIIDEENLT
jgi:hypothetical protein